MFGIIIENHTNGSAPIYGLDVFDTPHQNVVKSENV